MINHPNRSKVAARALAAATTEIYRPIDRPWNPATHKLVDLKTGADIVLPVTVKQWDGSEVTAVAFRPSKNAGGEGRICTDRNEIFVPSVIGAKIVEV